MFFLTPKYLKHGKLLLKGVTRFLHYKRDLLAPKRLAEIEDLRSQLKRAIKEKDAKRIDELTGSINQTCERALPDARMSALAENIEVFFVSIVIAMGIRTYIAQPFKIPTGSMQPTLNGYIAEPTAEDTTPSIPVRIAKWFTGATYINAVSDVDGELADGDPITEHNYLLFFPYCTVLFKDGHTINISAPLRPLMDPKGLARRSLRAGSRIRKGEVLARGILHSGDQVIVNKFSYHFRRPTRGEVFVFTTKNIEGIWDTMSAFDRLGGSEHYIKRLAGVPGDTIDVHSPELYINGHKATEFGFRRVIDEAKPVDQPHSYHGYSDKNSDSRIELPVTLTTEPRRQYFAMGDNSYSSSDSRFWGPVPEKNLVGPGWFCYWPITDHWGFIR